MQSYDGTNSNNQSLGHKGEQRTVFPRPATPWLLDGMPWILATTNAPQPGGVMQFGANANFNTETEPQCVKWQQKRKSLEKLASTLPAKQLITEERITAHFSGLQISGDPKAGSTINNNGVSNVHASFSLASDDIPSTSTGKTHHHPNPAYQVAAMELEQKLRNANRIVICDELKQCAASSVVGGSIPAELLLKSIPRPCTALVPWQPPPLAKAFSDPDQLQRSSCAAAPLVVDNELDDYDDDLDFFENNNTCSVNLNKADEQMDEDLDL